MEADHLEKLFEELKDSFDVAEPADGHRLRFLVKLEATSKASVKTKRNLFGWKPLSIAAAVLLFCSIGFNFLYTSPSVQQQVSKISPEISNTENYFASVIEDQVKKCKKKVHPKLKN